MSTRQDREARRAAIREGIAKHGGKNRLGRFDAMMERLERRAARIDAEQARRFKAKPEPKTFVYFVQAGHCGLIKIGKSRNPEHRLAEMQVGNGAHLRLVGTVGNVEEKTLHEWFAEHRVQGEWFDPVPRLVDLINGLYDSNNELLMTLREGREMLPRVRCEGPCPW